MRAFIGIDFKPVVKQKLYEIQQMFRGEALSGRWKHIDNFHLTLKFLSEIDKNQKTTIDSLMKRICEGYGPFYLKFPKLGAFYGRDSIRVLWVGLEGDLHTLRTLQRDIDENMKTVGFEPERRKYRPHITIGQDLSFDKSFDDIKNSLSIPTIEPVRVDRVNLFKSEQIGYRRVYTKVSEYLLYE